ncbi:MAG: protease pro-enzyme activation domain-containing protein [Bacteroidota bacterium]
MIRRLNVYYKVAIAILLLLGVFNIVFTKEPTIRLKGNLSSAISSGRQIGVLDKNQEIRLAITLPLRDGNQLDDFLKRLYTPGDQLFHHFLKTGEFAERFGPTQSDYDSVMTFMKKQGFRIVDTPPNRTVLDVAGSVGIINQAFGIHLMRYQRKDGSIFHAADMEPAVPKSIAGRISGILGLDDAVQMQPLSNGTKGTSGTGPGGGLSPSDIKTAYNLNGITENGTGQMLGLMEFDGYTTSDVTFYEDYFHLTHVPLENVLVDGFSGNPTAPTTKVPNPPGPEEVTLDIELMAAIAPGATKIIVYEAPNSTANYPDIANRIANENRATEISISWGAYEGAFSTSIRNGENTAYMQMAAQGQSIYAGSGDTGDQALNGYDTNGNPTYTFGVNDPASQPYVVAVGGTMLIINPLNSLYSSEIAWSGSGGGISTSWSLPNYQTANVSSGSGGSATNRNVPDVSLNSSTAYSIYYAQNGNPGWELVNGTSCAGPLWAAYTALVNQHRASYIGPIGFPNPMLYYIGNTQNYNSDFHDITTGNNGTYAAVKGYDNVTGWGTFDGGNLFNDMVQIYTTTIIYVDGNSPFIFPNGTVSSPFPTVSQGVAAASAMHPNLMYVKGYTYLENMTITKNILFVNNGNGPVEIGH